MSGHWIMPVQDDGMSDPIYYQVRCSKCGFDLDPQTWHQELHQYGADNFCPKCGSKMYEDNKGILEQLAEAQNCLVTTDKAWSDAIEKNGYVKHADVLQRLRKRISDLYNTDVTYDNGDYNTMDSPTLDKVLEYFDSEVQQCSHTLQPE